MTNNELLAACLRRLPHVGKNREQIARELGMSWSTVSRFLDGGRVRHATARRIACHLGVEL